jgi:Tol biopolymer transport system component
MVQDPTRMAVHRRDLAGEETIVTTEPKARAPAPGGPGQIVYWVHAGDVSEVRTAPLSGGPGRTLAKGGAGWVAGSNLFFIQEESQTIRRRALDGSLDEIVVEADSSNIFSNLAVSPDARWIAAVESGADLGPGPLCIGSLATTPVALDCTASTMVVDQRPAFSPGGRAVYFARGDTLSRYDLETHATTALPVSPRPTGLAIAPDGASAIVTNCKHTYQGLRVQPGGGPPTPLPAVANTAGYVAVGPHGELAFPVARDVHTPLAVTDVAGADVRVMTSGDRYVTEMAFSPDGSRVVFHDTTPETGGLFVGDVAGARAPTRITTDSRDTWAVWVDADHIAYAHPEQGVPNGHIFVVPAAGGEARALPKLPGEMFGSVPSRGTLLLLIESPNGDSFAEATVDGKVQTLSFSGMPHPMHWHVYVSASPSGRYIAWYSTDAAWRADLTTHTAAKVDFTWPAGGPETIACDDDGRLTVTFRHREGQLYRIEGTFR